MFSPGPKDFDFSQGAERVKIKHRPTPYGRDYDGIRSLSTPQLPFLINENILGKSFCSRSSSPLFGCPLLIITVVLETNKIS